MTVALFPNTKVHKFQIPLPSFYTLAGSITAFYNNYLTTQIAYCLKKI